jgi:hypothetical protein
VDVYTCTHVRLCVCVCVCVCMYAYACVSAGCVHMCASVCGRCASIMIDLLIFECGVSGNILPFAIVVV